jgi:CheY-like chemotaxis protein
MPTALIVDDSLTDRRLVCELLQRQSEWTAAQAASGAEALSRMEDVAPDVVVTDLMMPVMDGLELVTAVRAQYPEVPVILITAYGSETLAVEALERGAASYVPKSQIAVRLLDTMEEVLKLARAERSYERLIHCLTNTEFNFSLENDVALIDPLVELAQQMVVGISLCDSTERLRIGVAFREALLNALFHGCLELSADEIQGVREKLAHGKEVSLFGERASLPPYRDRRMFVHMNLTPDEARFVIRDQGPGFDVSAAREPSELGALEPERGRGIPLMRTFMDEVTYNDAGNEVTLVKRRETDADKADSGNP